MPAGTMKIADAIIVPTLIMVASSKPTPRRPRAMSARPAAGPATQMLAGGGAPRRASPLASPDDPGEPGASREGGRERQGAVGGVEPTVPPPAIERETREPLRVFRID